jgi:hypothetical protein
MGIRYMAPTLGKWTQPDQALSQARLVGANPYAYANCNPTNVVDPSGAVTAAESMIRTLGVGLLGGSGLEVLGLATEYAVAAEVLTAGTALAIGISGGITAAVTVYALFFVCPTDE